MRISRCAVLPRRLAIWISVASPGKGDADQSAFAEYGIDSDDTAGFIHGRSHLAHAVPIVPATKELSLGADAVVCDGQPDPVVDGCQVSVSSVA